MNKKQLLIKKIAIIAIFSALSIILYCVPGLQFALPFTPGFMKIHLEEIPILIVSFSNGPFVAFIIIILKSLFKLIEDIGSTGGVGVLADFIYSIVFIIPASIIYKYNRNIKGAIVGTLIGFILGIFFSSFISMYTIFPLYGFVIFGANNFNDATLRVGSMFATLDPSIKSCMDFKVFYEFLLPFNLIKYLIIIFSTFLVYKPLSLLINKKN